MVPPQYPLVILPLVLMLFTRHKVFLMLYFMFCYEAIGVDGIAYATVYYSVTEILRFAFDWLSHRRGL